MEQRQAYWPEAAIEAEGGLGNSYTAPIIDERPREVSAAVVSFGSGLDAPA